MTRSTTGSLLAGGVVALLLAGCGGTPEPSLTTSPTVRVDADVVYRTVDGESLSADVCRPRRAAGPLPTLVLVHGGGFDSGGSSGMRSLCEKVAENGRVAIAVDYRLLPSTYPAQVEDVAAAVDWAAEDTTAKAYGVDPRRIGVLGSSAGAIVAESIGVGMGGNVTPVRAVVALSGASELSATGLDLGETSQEAQDVILQYLGCPAVDDCPDAVEASPLTHVTARAAPMLLIAGSDELVPSDQSRVMADALTAVGVRNQVVVVDGSGHGLELMSTENLKTTDSFLSAQL